MRGESCGSSHGICYPVAVLGLLLAALLPAPGLAHGPLASADLTRGGPGEPATSESSRFRPALQFGAADLDVHQVGDSPDPVDPGNPLTYTIILTNHGPDPAEAVVVSDILPPETTFQSLTSPGGWSCTTPGVGAGGTVTCSAASVPVGSHTFTLVVQVTTTVPFGTVISNTVSASSSTLDPNIANSTGTATTTVRTQVADYHLTSADAPDPVEPGALLTYTLTASNEGPDALYAANLAQVLPAGTTFHDLVAPAGWACATPAVGSTGQVSCDRPSMPVGTDVFELVVGVDRTAPISTTLAATSILTSTTVDRRPGETEATAFTLVYADYRRFLPVVRLSEGDGPDLVVDELVATASAVTVTLRNAGVAAVVDSFWVDLYFDPTRPPAVNTPWQQIAARGAAWGVTDAIGAGASVVLVTGGPYFAAGQSSLPPYPVGAAVWALADSVDYSSDHGAVLETNEGNNLHGPIVSVAGAASGSPKAGGMRGTAGLPKR